MSRCGFGLSCWGLRHSDKTWLCEKMAHRADWAKTKHSKLMMAPGIEPGNGQGVPVKHLFTTTGSALRHFKI
ncbi:hypothetical protein [Escherichia coli ISC41]|nr:hypothetical protein [Escherichia coli ISC41]